MELIKINDRGFGKTTINAETIVNMYKNSDYDVIITNDQMFSCPTGTIAKIESFSNVLDAELNFKGAY